MTHNQGNAKVPKLNHLSLLKMHVSRLARCTVPRRIAQEMKMAVCRESKLCRMGLIEDDPARNTPPLCNSNALTSFTTHSAMFAFLSTPGCPSQKLWSVCAREHTTPIAVRSPETLCLNVKCGEQHSFLVKSSSPGGGDKVGDEGSVHGNKAKMLPAGENLEWAPPETTLADDAQLPCPKTIIDGPHRCPWSFVGGVSG